MPNEDKLSPNSLPADQFADQTADRSELSQYLQWPKTTLTATADGYLVEWGDHQFTLPAPDRLKTDTIHTLLNRLKIPATEEASLLGDCTLIFRLVPDWDGPGEIVEVVIVAPKATYERLQNKPIYASIISIMTTMVCDHIGSDCLECAAG